mmetsp:Transcript_20295/g.22979  ORF Transcript_20295/g.22979 Transcript_20295/m.22979 type:complete len:438 (-) Transcript_20295:156-1469(-)
MSQELSPQDPAMISSSSLGDEESLPLTTITKTNEYDSLILDKLSDKDNDSTGNTYGTIYSSSPQPTLNGLVPDKENFKDYDTASHEMDRLKQQGSDAYPNLSLRRIAIDISLYLNLIILASKSYAYIQTLSLSVLAALTDSLLDVVSQIVLNYTERHSSKSRSSALYPAGAARLEPLGVLICAALMGMASFEIVKESAQSLLLHGNGMESLDSNMLSVYGMILIVVVKLALYFLCDHAIPVQKHSNSVYKNNGKQSVKVSDPTLEALAQDHWNDSLSNAVAAAALLAALMYPGLWFLDPFGAILISMYIIYSWYETGKEQIEQLTGKSAPDEFIEELHEIASNFDKRMLVDVVRAYHFGPKFLVELEVVLPKDTMLFESHDLGMELQYEIEGREEVERCFVHIDYEQRPYDEHVVSKVPELRAKYRPSANSSFCHSV